MRKAAVKIRDCLATRLDKYELALQKGLQTCTDKKLRNQVRQRFLSEVDSGTYFPSHI